MKYQEQMIELGIFDKLYGLLFSDKTQIRTQALAMIQYFDGNSSNTIYIFNVLVLGKYQTTLIQSGISSHLLKLLSATDPNLLMKTLSAIQHFDSNLRVEFKLY